MSRVALGLEYDGRFFEGWQIQPHGRTVQNALQNALAQIAGEAIDVVCAGRTDTGVHAALQVVHFDTPVQRPLSAWVRGVNAHLPETLSVLWAQEVNADFHARFSATGRHYRYFLLNRPTRPALVHGRAGWCHVPLDVAAMQAGAEYLLGEHDFSAFRAAQCQAHSPVRTLTRASVQRAGEWIVLDFSANAFLHHMVRNLVGALVYVGKGELQARDIEQLLLMRDRHRSPPTFSPAGLYLCGVDYPDLWHLPAQGRIIAPLSFPG